MAASGPTAVMAKEFIVSDPPAGCLNRPVVLGIDEGTDALCDKELSQTRPARACLPDLSTPRLSPLRHATVQRAEGLCWGQ